MQPGDLVKLKEGINPREWGISPMLDGLQQIIEVEGDTITLRSKSKYPADLYEVVQGDYQMVYDYKIMSFVGAYAGKLEI